MSGADFLVPDSLVGAKRRDVKPARRLADGIVVTPDEIDAVLHETGKSAKQLVAGIERAAAGIQSIREAGLTGEALVILVTEKCGTYVTDGKRTMRPTAAAVQCVLEALLKLGEYAR